MPTCSAVPQPTAPLRAPISRCTITKNRRVVDLLNSLPSIALNIAAGFIVFQTVYSNRKLIFVLCELNDLHRFLFPL